MKEEKELYLEEDRDLLDDVERLGDVQTGHTLSKQERKMGESQIRATLRTRKTMVDLDKSNKKFTLVILFITIVQVLLALFQFAYDIASNPSTKNIIGGFLMFIFFAFIVFFFLKKFKAEIAVDL